MEKNILAVVNPNAGSMDKEELIEVLEGEFSKLGYRLEILQTTGDNDDQNIKNKLRELKPWRVLVAGGDGTINMVAKVLDDYDTTMSILPYGSANGLARNLNIPDDNLQEQIKIATSEKVCEIDHLKVNGETCLHISDLGLNAELISNFENSPIRGKFGYFLQSIPTLINSESPFDFNIEIEGKSISKSGILLAIANAQQYGTGANINPEGKMDDGKFEVLVFKSFDIPEIINTIYDKANLNSDFAECFSTDKVVITSEKPIPFQIDGEPKGSVTRVEALIHHKKLRITVP